MVIPYGVNGFVYMITFRFSAAPLPIGIPTEGIRCFFLWSATEFQYCNRILDCRDFVSMKILVDRFDDQFVVGEAEVGILLVNVRF